MSTCLILVDLQNDFMPGGALAVPRGNEVVEFANRLAPRFEYVVASQDWHPSDHRSFASQHTGRSPGEVVDLEGLDQVLWPDHCVQATLGADFHKDLDLEKVHAIFQKGTDRNIDSYSTFFDNSKGRSTGLGEDLLERGTKAVWMLGLATDYCVKYSALDACSLGLQVHVVPEGCRGIDLAPGDIDRAWDEMRAAGVKIVPYESVR